MTDSARMIFSGMSILHGRQWVKDHAVITEAGMIKAIIAKEMIKHHLPAQQHVFSAHHYLIPGLIDLHIHGANGHDVMDDSDVALQGISHALAAEGVTGFLATTMTAENQRLESVLKTIALIAPTLHGAALLGVHLEGPFIANEKMGAQRAVAQAPDLALLQAWQVAAQKQIKLVTMAPEIIGALPVIEALAQMGIMVAAGHTNATYTQTCAAIAAGCRYATHLFNAMRGLHQREPGAAGALLLSEQVTAELIVDGLHLHPAIIDLALRIKGKDKLVLVSDAMRAKCLGDGEYELGGQTVTVKAGKATLADGTLAGSTLRLPQALQQLVKYTLCTLADAIAMASENPARLLGLFERKGSIEVGKDADMVVLDSAYHAALTVRGGKVIYKAD